MWRRALLAAAVLSYLICVLIMSGIQKEDLDASTLRKLQRHNVNIADVDNDQISQQCSTRNIDLTTLQSYKMDERAIVTTEPPTTTTKTENPARVSLNVETLLNYLKNRQNYNTHSGQLTTEKQETAKPVPVRNDRPIIDENILRRFIQLETQNKSVYKLDHSSEITKHSQNISIKTKDDRPSVANNVEIIDTFFNDYLFLKQTTPTTTQQTTTTRIFDINNVYKQIDEIIAKEANLNIEKDKVGVPNKVSIATKNNQENSKEPDDSKNKLTRSFYNFLTQMSRYKNAMNLQSPQYSDIEHSHSIKDQKQTGETLDKMSQALLDKNHEITDKPKEDRLQKDLSPNLVKEIAETVKEVIIKDLRKELSNIYRPTQTTVMTSTTTKMTTKTEISPTTSVKSTTREDSSLMGKFMELYKEIKSLKQATYFLKPDTRAETFIKELKSPSKTAFLLPIQNPGSKFGYYDTKHNFNPETHYPPRQVINHHSPITIQTNSVEIKPLAIPLSKPESLIRQNIVVTPTPHLQIRGNIFKHNPLKLYEGYNSAGFPSYTGSQNTRQAKPRHDLEDIIRFRVRNEGNSRYDTDYYEKINVAKHNIPGTEKREAYDKAIPRFHERLENVDTESYGIPRSERDPRYKQEHSDDIPSRQQLSLIDMKRGSSYDDMHFKNFLNTQQKVTDMLERILANRPNVSKVRSVETL